MQTSKTFRPLRRSACHYSVVHGEIPQKALIFKLFSCFCEQGSRKRGARCSEGPGIRKEADVPPKLREKLAPLWGKSTQLCHECGGALGADPVAESRRGEERHWCSRACEHAAKNYKFRCPECGCDELVPGSVQSKPMGVGCAYRAVTCAGCARQHSWMAYRWTRDMGPRPPVPERPGPPREPAWKRRRRA
jgi:hypothetical protein